MQQLLGDNAGTTDGSIIRELFLQRLPANVRMVLATTKDTPNLEDLTQLADKIVEVASPSVSSVCTPQLTTEVDQLRTEVASLKKPVKSLSSKRRTSRGRSPSPARSHSPTDTPTCWYHL